MTAIKLLFTPSPLTTSPSLKAAMMHDAGSRDADFLAVVRSIRNRLLAIGGAAPGGDYECVGDQPAPSKNLHRKEVDPGQHGQMRLDEFLPPCVLAPFRDRRDAMTLQDVPHSLIRDVIAEIGQRTHNPVVAPTGILPRHLDDQLLQFRFDRRPTRVAAEFGSIEFLRNQLPVPSQNGVRLGNAGDLCQRFAPEALPNVSKRGSFRIG